MSIDYALSTFCIFLNGLFFLALYILVGTQVNLTSYFWKLSTTKRFIFMSSYLICCDTIKLNSRKISKAEEKNCTIKKYKDQNYSFTKIWLPKLHLSLKRNMHSKCHWLIQSFTNYKLIRILTEIIILLTSQLHSKRMKIFLFFGIVPLEDPQWPHLLVLHMYTYHLFITFIVIFYRRSISSRLQPTISHKFLKRKTC